MSERAPESLRSALLHLLDERGRWSEGEFDPYHELSRILGKIGNEWGPSEKQYEVRSWVNALTLAQTQAILSEIPLDDREEEALNSKLALAGEEIRVYGGTIVSKDEVGEALDLLGLAQEPLGVLKGPFQPVLQQYQRALNAMNTHPMEQEKAISEAMGALEAVVRLVGGGKDFGPNVTALFANEQAWTRLLSKTISQFQGYRSQVPGAGHGRYQDSDVTDAEAEFFVRASGAAIAWILNDHEAGRW